MITRDEREIQKAFKRAVFNVLFHNRDDHAKNLAYRMDAKRHWKLAPCFDLTYSEGPGGEHQMDICGEGLNITRSHLTKLAQQGGLDARWAAQRLDTMLKWWISGPHWSNHLTFGERHDRECMKLSSVNARH